MKTEAKTERQKVVTNPWNLREMDEYERAAASEAKSGRLEK